MASPCEWGQHAKFLQLPWDPDLDRKSWQDGKESKIHTAGIQAAVRKESQRTIHLFSWTSTAKSNGVVFPRLLTFYGPDFQALIFSTLSNTWVLWSDPSVCSWWTLLRLVLCVFLKLPNWKRTSVLLVWGGAFSPTPGRDIFLVLPRPSLSCEQPTGKPAVTRFMGCACGK